MKINLIILVLLAVSISSCNKEERYSRRWQQKEEMSGEWQVSELSVEDINDSIIPRFEIYDCDIYTDTCFGKWKTGEQSADFIWQFQNKGKEFVFFRQNSADSADFLTDISEVQCYNYSGTYSVIKAKKKEMIFESEATVGYSGQKVRIVLERQD